MSFNVIKTTLIELEFLQNDTLQKRYFNAANSAQFLREKDIVSIETYSVNDIPVSPFTKTNVLPDSAQFKSASLTLYGNNPEVKIDSTGSAAPAIWMDTIPLVSLHRLNNLVDPFVFALYSMVPRRISWEKSYIELSAVLGNADAPLSFVFLVGYMGNNGDN